MSQFFVSENGGNVPPTVATRYTADNGSFAVPAANNINLFTPGNGTKGIKTTASGSTVTFTVINDGFAWSDQNANFDANIQNGYFCIPPGMPPLVIQLPPNLSFLDPLSTGNTIIIYLDAAALINIIPAAGQSIQVGTATYMTGIKNSAAIGGGTITLVYRSSDSTWHTISSVGTWVKV